MTNPTIERTDQGDQFVMPGCEQTGADRQANVGKLIRETAIKLNAADRMGDDRFTDAMKSELTRLRRILRKLAPEQGGLL